MGEIMSYPPNDPQQPWQPPQGQPPQQQPPAGQPPQQPPAQQPYQPEQQHPQQYPQTQQYPATPGQEPYAQTQQYPQTYPAGEQQGAGGMPPNGNPPKKKSPAGWIAGGAALLLIIIAGVVGVSIGNAAHAPENQVTAYLDLLKAGKAKQALEASGTKLEKTDVLLTDKAYKAADDRISKYSIESSDVDGDTATVTANITQGGESYEQDFTLSKAGKDMVLFDKWKLEAPELGLVSYAVTGPTDAPLTVNGVAVSGEGDDGVFSFRALPGSYAIELDGEAENYAAETATATVAGFGEKEGEAPEVAVTLSESGITAAEDAVNVFLDECEASTELAPDGCPNWGNDTGVDKVEDIVWTFDPRPDFTVADYDGSAWTVTTETDGAYNIDCTIIVGDQKQTHTSFDGGAIDFDVDGAVTFAEDGTAAFEWAG